ncbi:MAG: hypothetical protein Q3995_07275, partial [Eubacteriales bacterium]|nr:hypothetical protein [Eubacteriales bacterium]
MEKRKRTRELIIFACIVLLLFVGAVLTGSSAGEQESIREVMKDAVLHESAKVSLFGFAEVNPGLISAYVVTGILILLALICRIFVIPKFTVIPGTV